MKTKRVRKTQVNGLVRYPGGKGKLCKDIIPRLQRMLGERGADAEFREPFLGSGAVALAVLSKNPQVRRAWINDGDPSMAALWQTVIHNPTSLHVLVEVLPEAMRLLKVDYYRGDVELLRSIADVRDVRKHPPGIVAAAKLAVHQMSYSGFGPCGGPMTKRLSRYNVDTLCSKIYASNEILSSVKLRQGTCTCRDFEDLFDPGVAVFYLDPPYVEKGPELYQFPFTDADHERLAKRLRGEQRPWLLSYDDHPLVHRLYGDWSHIERVEVTYSANKCKSTTRKTTQELLITKEQ
jgi:DNA adenine methylase